MASYLATDDLTTSGVKACQDTANKFYYDPLTGDVKVAPSTSTPSGYTALN